MNLSRLNYLFEKLHGKAISDEGKAELWQMLADNANETALKEFIGEKYKNQQDGLKMSEEAASHILDVIFEAGKEPAKVLHLTRPSNRIYRMVAAAVILVVAGLTSFFFFQNDPSLKKPIANELPVNLPPGHDGAILTLSDGKQIVLDSALNGNVANEGGNTITKQNGKLSYSENTYAANALYNTMSTPRGRTFQLSLSDGSKVWLNAASSIKFPVVFTGDERRVEITGEVYFEVAHNPAKPFTIKVNEGEVQVLGTHFNVNAYSDEPVMKTTLLEGKVRVRRGNAIVILKPGQQAQVSDDGIRPVNDVDVDGVIAWKKGLFEFSKADLPTILRQVSRWYDVDIVYEGKPAATRYGGGIARNLPLSEVLDLLKSNGVAFRLEGKRLIVLP